MSARRGWGWAGLAVAGLLAASVAGGDLPKTDNSVDSLLGADAPAARDYRAFRETFAADDLTLVSLSGGELDTFLDLVQSVHAVLRSHDELQLVVTASTAFGSTLSALSDPALRGPEATAALRGPLNEELRLLQLDPPRARFLAASPPGAPPKGLLADLEHLRDSAAAQGAELHLAGTAVLNAAIDRAGERIATRALPAVVGLASLLLFLALRRVRAVLFLLGTVGLVIFGIDALYGALGGTDNVLVAIHRPVAFVLILASGVHLLEAWRSPESADAFEAAAAKSRPIRLALFTTATGFASLAVSELPPIRNFGLLTAACLAAAMPIVLGFLPFGLRWARPPRGEDPWTERGALGAAQLGIRYPMTAISVAFAVIAGGALAGSRVPIDTHAIHYFGEDTQVRKDHEAIETSGLGLQSLEVLLELDDPFRPQPAAVKALDDFAGAVRSLDHVTTRFDPALLLLEAGYRVAGRPVPPDPLTLEEVWTDDSPWKQATLADRGRVVRCAFLIETIDAAALDTLEDEIRNLAEDHLGLSASAVRVTGNYRLLLEAQRSLLRTLLWSLLLTAVVMQVVLGAALRSVRLGVFAMLPNLLPVAATFVVMLAARIPLDLGTCMVASLSLGIAVDDTLHFTLAWNRRDLYAAARKSGRAILLTSLVMSLGFAVLVPSEFRPASAFGILSATALLSAVLGDLVVLPALLTLDARRARRTRS